MKSKLKQEEDEDTLYRQQFGQKWTRTESKTNTKEYTAKINQYEENLKIGIGIDNETEQRLN